MTRRHWTVLVVGLALIAGGGLFLVRAKGHQRLAQPGLRVAPGDTESGLAVLLPERVRQYTSTNVPPQKLEVDVLPKDTTFGYRLYRAPAGQEILLRVVMMGADRTSIHKPEWCLSSQGWRITDQESATVRMEEPYPYDLPVRKLTLNARFEPPDGGPSRSKNALYVYWFVSGERLTASHWERNAYLTWDLLRTGELPRWAYVSCFAEYLPGQEEATYLRISQFLSAAVPQFQTVAAAPRPANR